MWLQKKQKQTDAYAQVFGDFDLVPSLRQVGRGSGLKPEEMSLSVVLTPGGEEMPTRMDILIGNGTRLAEWRVESLRTLFRGDRQPPSDSEIGRYPVTYVPFFHRIEYNVYRYCSVKNLSPTDAEFLDIYAQMRRRPDGKSLGPLHDVIWQSVALVLGLQAWSEAEYMAVFGQLARSARHFKMGISSRNYIDYVRKALGQED